MAVGRNRVIYQSEALLFAPSATGANSSPSGIKRVQSANYSFTVNRQDVNQFGELGRLDSMILESPTVSLDFSYYPLSGEQEHVLGFNTDNAGGFLSGLLKSEDFAGTKQNCGGNYYIVTTAEGTDALKVTDPRANTTTTIGIGNAEITDYTFEASVGALPTVSVTAEGMNINAVTGLSGTTPAVSPQHGGYITGSDNNPLQFNIPNANLESYSQETNAFAALRPGDIVLDLQDSAVITDQVSGSTAGQTWKDDTEDAGAAHIQSFSINVPMSRTVLQRIGSNYGYARVLDVPIQGSFTVNAIVSDLKKGNLIASLCDKDIDLTVTIYSPDCRTGANQWKATERALVWEMKQCTLESEAISSSIGDNKTVDLTYNYQVAGPNDTDKGIFLSGAWTA
jgi:hypothetical protein